MAVVKDIFRILKNGIWDEHHFRTSADQVFYTKEDGTASNVQKELAAQNSTLPEISRQGYWEICKFPSGLMIQTYYATDVQIQTNGISGALFYTTEPVQIGNFPVPFVETPDIDCHLIKTKGAICFVPGIEQLSITFPGYFYVMSTNQGQNAISFKVRAEGRWK